MRKIDLRLLRALRCVRDTPVRLVSRAGGYSCRAVWLLCALLTLGCSDGDATSDKDTDTASAQAALEVSPTPLPHRMASSSPIAETLTFELPSIASELTVALGAGERLAVEPHARVVRTNGTFATIANTGVQGTSLGAYSVSGTVWSTGDVRVGPRAEVQGDITTEGKVRSHGEVTGTVVEDQAIETRTVTHTVTFPQTSAGSVRVRPRGNRTLEPGRYARVHVGPKATLTLVDGEYFFESLHVAPEAKLHLLNAERPVVAWVRGHVQITGEVSEAATGELTANFRLGVVGQDPVSIYGPFRGTVLAPKAHILLGHPGTKHEGAFFGKSVRVGPKVTVVHRPFPSLLIRRVVVSKTDLCPNESALVEVEAAAAPGSATEPTVTINGLSGDKRHIQFRGQGEFLITVIVHDPLRNIAQSRTIPVQIRPCDQVFPQIITTPTLRPYEVGFVVTNANELTGENRRFKWDFGDGATTTSAFPYVTHSYAHAIEPEEATLSFEAELMLQRDGMPDIVSKETVVIPNLYAETAARGFVRPPVTHGRELVRAGKEFLAELSIRNVEHEPIALTRRRVDRHRCDPDLDPLRAPTENIDIAVPGRSLEEFTFPLPATSLGSDICGVSIHLFGSTSAGTEVRASAHFETGEPGFFAAPVANPATIDLLNEVTSEGLVPDADRVTLEQLRRLKREGQIDDVPDLSDVESGALPSSSEVIGSVCDPEEAPPVTGVSCQTQPDDWTVSPPLIRNALKGELLITAGCGVIGELLRAVEPAQSYSHEGIMTRNYLGLSHSTAADGRIADSVDPNGFKEGLQGTIFDEEKLKFAWPGSLHESINTAVNGLFIADPEGNLRRIDTFSPDPTRCQGDSELLWPLVIRSSPDASQAVRDHLREAADFANASETHYRFFGFSQANIAFDADNNFAGRSFRDPKGEPATVSTSFIWHALKSVGIPLEGDVLEREDERSGGEPPFGPGIIDGLYLYTEDERRSGLQLAFNSTKNAVETLQESKAGPFGDVIDFLNNQSDEVAAQFTNCFASDKCGRDGIYKLIPEPLPDPPPPSSALLLNRDFENPGIGIAVSPDNFLMWDAPYFGDREHVHYVSGEYRRVHRWAASEDAGALCATVELEDGTPVDDARVTVAGQVGGTDAGEVCFEAVPAGTYEVRGEKDIDDELVFDAEVVEIEAGMQSQVALILSTEEPPPPSIELFERKLSFSGTLKIFDDDTNNPFTDPDNEFVTYAVSGACTVSPFDRNVTVTAKDFSRRVLSSDDNKSFKGLCVDNEVRGNVEIFCTLAEDNETIDYTVRVTIAEGDDCNESIDDEATVGRARPETLEASARRSHDLKARTGGGDFVRFDAEFINVRGESLGETPNVQPENRRRVFFTGDIFMLDHDGFLNPNETKNLTFDEACSVDPFNRTAEFIWDGSRHDVFGFEPDANAKACVDDELRLELHVTCRLSTEDFESVSVETNAYLYEGTTCVTGDQDGHERREVLLAPGATSSMNAPSSGDLLRVRNEDEGGDRIDIRVTMENRQQ